MIAGAIRHESVNTLCARKTATDTKFAPKRGKPLEPVARSERSKTRFFSADSTKKQPPASADSNTVYENGHAARIPPCFCNRFGMHYMSFYVEFCRIYYFFIAGGGAPVPVRGEGPAHTEKE